MSQYKTQEDLDKAVDTIRSYSNSQLIDSLCEAWHMYRRLTEIMKLEQAKYAHEDYCMMQQELHRRGIL